MVMMYLTVDDHATALEIAEKILEERLSNHVNIISANHCKVWKDGKIVDSMETLLLIKTKALLYPAIEQQVHDMKLINQPKILSVPITQLDMEYYKFLRQGIIKV